MARTHHRKKHKEQLRQFKHDHDSAVSSSTNSKSKVTTIFIISGAATGLAVSYFGAGGSAIAIITGIIIGALGGYLIGRKIDTDK